MDCQKMTTFALRLAGVPEGRFSLIADFNLQNMDYQEIIDSVLADVSPLRGAGRVADYIPALASADPSKFGIAVATPDGVMAGAGDWATTFSIQSMSKVFALTRVVRHPALRDLPFCLETPNELPGYAREIALMRERAE